MNSKMLIDGYNVIFAHPLWKNLELVEAREMLIKEAINHSFFFDGMIIIVFDGSRKENSFGEKVGKTFNIPVFMFSESAKFPLRKFIDDIRANEYEGLEEQLKDPRWKPDFGPDIFNADSGATIIGARYPLVSFKIFLNTL